MLHTLAEYNNMTHARYNLLTLPISAVTLLQYGLYNLHENVNHTRRLNQEFHRNGMLWTLSLKKPIHAGRPSYKRCPSSRQSRKNYWGTAGTKFRRPSYRVVHQESVDCTISLTWLKGIQIRVSSCIGIIYPSFLYFFIFIYYLSVYSFT